MKGTVRYFDRFTQQLIQYQTNGTDGDGAVCDVEGGEGSAAQVEVQEVHHVAVLHAVHDVADGAAEDAGQREAEQLLPRMRAQLPDDEDGGGQADAGERPALPAAGIGQEAEGGAGVVGTNHIEEARDVGGVAQLVVAEDEHLGELVGQEDHHGPGEPGPDAAAAGAAGARHDQTCARVSPVP
ncbi:hypothetical protein SDC9_91580 [bioreactor metagenome]|uniref:Uncharacterized protein n=1 Tax=bioreactor metagenome TaxID=1076179 RepID=A0A644ZWV7_9ZZZZ